MFSVCLDWREMHELATGRQNHYAQQDSCHFRYEQAHLENIILNIVSFLVVACTVVASVLDGPPGHLLLRACGSLYCPFIKGKPEVGFRVCCHIPMWLFLVLCDALVYLPHELEAAATREPLADKGSFKTHNLVFMSAFRAISYGLANS